MKEVEEGKFIIINNKHLEDLAGMKEVEELKDILKRLWEYNALPDHRYMAFNMDEHYAEDVQKIILQEDSELYYTFKTARDNSPIIRLMDVLEQVVNTLGMEVAPNKVKFAVEWLLSNVEETL